MERSPYWYIGSLHILNNTYTTALTTKQVASKVLFPPCLIEHIPLSRINNKASVEEEWISKKNYS